MKKVPNLDPLYLDSLYNLSKICNFSSLADFQLIIICTLSHPGWWHACIFLLLLHSLSLCCLSASSTSSGLSLLSCVSLLMWFWRNDERDRVLNNCFDVPPVLRSTGSTWHSNTIIRYLKVGLFQWSYYRMAKFKSAESPWCNTSTTSKTSKGQWWKFELCDTSVASKTK